MEVLDYDQLVAEFESKLVTQLRSFGADAAEYLEMWVPDENPVKSILNMVEAAEAYGRSDIAVRIGPNTLTADQLKELVAHIGKLGRADVRPDNGQTVITVTEIGQQ
ncbi:MAG: hypothetical protein JWN71_1530 [Xanthobacteraceae bacterium]|nr:hypothetical protein [Xanthobacteraceae bacterium]